jgi:hypothetical protein
MTGAQPDAVFHGGPRDGDVFVASGADRVAVPEGPLVHRYLSTEATDERGGRSLTVYTYDGLIPRSSDPGH